VASGPASQADRLGLSHSIVKHGLATARSKVGATRTAQLSGSWPRGCRNPRASPPRRFPVDHYASRSVSRLDQNETLLLDA